LNPAPIPTAFATPRALRAWLERHHGTAAELYIRCYKSHAKEKGVTYTQALDEALCYGWIDGVRRSFDEDSFSVRFTPRRPKSVWSAVNIRRAGELEAAGRMRPSGLAALCACGGAAGSRGPGRAQKTKAFTRPRDVYFKPRHDRTFRAVVPGCYGPMTFLEMRIF
jgi:uncharacterized protein YdeI (YjbR/CyaY-like superfamily)